MNFLLVEDDRSVGLNLRRRIEGAGHILDWTAEGRQAVECASSSSYDAVIVGLGVSDGRGIELCAELRRISQALPILVLSAGDRLADRLESFSAGADDVLAKPFDFDELMARLAAIQRRRAPGRVDSAARPTHMIVLDRESNAAWRTSRIVELTDRESRFFDGLLKHKSKGVAPAAAFRDDRDLDGRQACADAPGMRLALQRGAAIMRAIGRKFVLAGVRIARRRA